MSCNCPNKENKPSVPCHARKCCSGGETTTSNSVLLSSGQFTWSLPLPGTDATGGSGFSMNLEYLSDSGANNLTGIGFEVMQALRIEKLVNGDIQYATGRHTSEIFAYDSLNNTYLSTDNNFAGELIRSGSGAAEEYTLRFADGSQMVFFGFDDAIDTPGVLKYQRDTHGNTQILTWQVTDNVIQLASQTDAYGRTITFTYHDVAHGHRLAESTDFLGRKLTFWYDTLGHLTAVVLPAIAKAASGNEFPNGMAYAFKYDTSNANAKRQNDLIAIYYPNQVAPYLNSLRQVDIAAVYASATPRYQVTYGQNANSPQTFGKVLTETVGDPANTIGGTYSFSYAQATAQSIFYTSTSPRKEDLIAKTTTVTDRNGNQTVYGFNLNDMPVKIEVRANRNKSSLQAASYVTWTRYNTNNQPTLKIMPVGNSIEYVYDNGMVNFGSGSQLYAKRRGLLLSETRKPGNTYGIASRAGSNGQTQLTKRYFYDPIFNQQIAVITERGNPIDTGGVYSNPQNAGSAPTDADRSRYVTVSMLDYQKNTLSTISSNAELQNLLSLNASQIQALIAFVDTQMKATDGTGGLPEGFKINLGDINGDGTGDGAASGLQASRMQGSVVKIQHPGVRQVDGTWQNRSELFTVNARGQNTTYTSPEGNVTVYVRYPENDPDGDGEQINVNLSNHQYGYMKEIHVDANPADVMALVGASGDLVAFVPGKITRTNTPGVYQNLVTGYENATGCTTCAYDALGNPTSITDPRGLTTIMERNEIGEVYRTITAAPYGYQTETHYDANRNVVRVDTEDRTVQYASDDPTQAAYGTFIPANISGSTAQVPMKAGPGGTLRPGWFSNLMNYDLLDSKISDTIDATGSTPASLVTSYEYDANQNVIKITKPQGNSVEYDYDERNLRIAERTGRDASVSESGALTFYSYDKNGNLLHIIGPADRSGQAGTRLSVTIEDAFGSGTTLTHTGDWLTENIYDGFDRQIASIDAVGNRMQLTYDPNGRVIQTEQYGPIGGASPTDRTGANNVLLARSIVRYDEAGRTYEQQRDVFIANGITLGSGRTITQVGGGLASNSTINDHTGTATLTSGQNSYVLSRIVYDRAGRTAQSISDNTAVSTYDYDGANRVIRTTDALGNKVDNQYDANGNMTRITRTEYCTITFPANIAPEVFASAMWYDSLNRLVARADQGADGLLSADLADISNPATTASAILTRIGYDSRNNQVLAIDPNGNSTIMIVDGAGRTRETHQLMRTNGKGGNGPESGTFETAGGRVRTQYSYDANSRLITQTDDNGDVTTYAYDTLDRQTSITFADGSVRVSEYNPANDLTTYTDENGSILNFVYNAIGQKTSLSITRAAGVLGTTAQSFEYDGLGRTVHTADNVDTAPAVADFVYDSLNRMLEEKQSYDGHTRYVSKTKWTGITPAELTHPSGTKIGREYDVLYRMKSLNNSDNIKYMCWEFFGASRIAEMIYYYGDSSNTIGTIMSHMNNARTHSAVQTGVNNPDWGDWSTDRLGYDGSGRMICKRTRSGGINTSTGEYGNNTPLLAFTAIYDKAGNKQYERNILYKSETRSYLYASYDSFNRLREAQRGTLATGGGSIAIPITMPQSNTTQTYNLDGVGNWNNTTYTPVGGSSTTQTRIHNDINQITQIGSEAITYDHGNDAGSIHGNGNLVDDNMRKLGYDALNRLVELRRSSDNQLIATYAYDALGRRIQKSIADLGSGVGGITGDIPAGTTDYLYDGQQIIEDRNTTTDVLIAWYVWGQYIDELAIMGMQGCTQPVFSDMLYRVVWYPCGEQFSFYDPYGKTRTTAAIPIILNDGNPILTNPLCRYLFTGREYDAESQLYHYRARTYHPDLGRFCQKDPIGYVDGMGLYEYVGNKPVNFIDPFGYAGTEAPTTGPTTGPASAPKPILDQYQDAYSPLLTGPLDQIMVAQIALMAERDRLNQNDSNATRLFTNTQMCILKKLAANACPCLIPDDAEWLKNVVNDFMRPLIQTLRDRSQGALISDLRWRAFFGSLDKGDYRRGPIPEKYAVPQAMALNHIQSDLWAALMNRGYGHNYMWKCIGNVVDGCFRENVTPPEANLGDRAGRFIDSLNVSKLRDMMRDRVKAALGPGYQIIP